MVTIKDISRVAGVSTATVSKVLNGDYSKVSDQTKQRVLKTAKELGYRPNRLARGLVQSKTNIIGLIVPDIANPYFADLARGVEDTARTQGYKMILSNSDESAEKEREYLEVLLEYNADGIIITGNNTSEDDLAEYRKNTPMVAIDRYLGDDVCTVSIDNFGGSYMATEHLIQHGHRRIAYIGGAVIDTHVPKNRLNGYLKALRDYGIDIDLALIEGGSYQHETGYFCVHHLLNQGLSFTAIVCGNDLMAFGALRALRERGYSVPDDVSLVGYDDIYLTELIDPPLTTVKQPTYELGRAAMDFLSKLMHHETITEKVHHFTPQLVVRQSVARIESKTI